jgi:hypothetical protein
MPAGLFNFPYHVCSDEYPESSTRVRFGQGYEFASRPSGPEQRVFILNFPAMWFYESTTPGVLDTVTNAERNAGTLQQFYETMQLWQTFDYPHPTRGVVPVRFQKPLPPLKGVPLGNGKTEPFEVRLIEEPILSQNDVAYIREAREIVEAFDTPPSNMLGALINYTTGRLIAAKLWPLITPLYMLASHTLQSTLVNWKDVGPVHDLGVAGTITFNAQQGLTGTNTAVANNLSARQLNSYSRNEQNNAAFFVWVLNNVVSTYPCIGHNGTPGGISLNPRNGSNQAILQLNSTTLLTVAGITDARGLWMGQRTGSGTIELYKDNVLVGSGPATSEAVSSAGPFRILGGGSAQSTAHQLALAGMCAPMTAAQKTAFRKIMYDHLKGVGASVI